MQLFSPLFFRVCFSFLMFLMFLSWSRVDFGLSSIPAPRWSGSCRERGESEGRAAREEGGRGEKARTREEVSITKCAFRLWACPVEFGLQPEIQLNLNRRETRWRSRLSLSSSLCYFSPPLPQPGVYGEVFFCGGRAGGGADFSWCTKEQGGSKEKEEREEDFSLLLCTGLSPQNERRDQLEKAERKELECEMWEEKEDERLSGAVFAVCAGQCSGNTKLLLTLSLLPAFLSAFCTQTLLSVPVLWLFQDCGVFLGADSVNDRLSAPCARCHPQPAERALKLQLLLPSGLHMGPV